VKGYPKHTWTSSSRTSTPQLRLSNPFPLAPLLSSRRKLLPSYRYQPISCVHTTSHTPFIPPTHLDSPYDSVNPPFDKPDPHPPFEPNMSSSNVTSPQSAFPFSPDNSNFDFLQFMGIESSTSPYSNSHLSADPGSAKSVPEDEPRTNSSRGRSRLSSGRHSRGARSSSSGAQTATGGAMEVDSHQVMPFGPSQMLGMQKEVGAGQFSFGMGGTIGQGQGQGQDYDAHTAHMLQQQVSCHRLCPFPGL
jgi:hypothetical protein